MSFFGALQAIKQPFANNKINGEKEGKKRPKVQNGRTIHKQTDKLTVCFDCPKVVGADAAVAADDDDNDLDLCVCIVVVIVTIVLLLLLLRFFTVTVVIIIVAVAYTAAFVEFLLAVVHRHTHTYKQHNLYFVLFLCGLYYCCLPNILLF